MTYEQAIEILADMHKDQEQIIAAITNSRLHSPQEKEAGINRYTEKRDALSFAIDRLHDGIANKAATVKQKRKRK